MSAAPTSSQEAPLALICGGGSLPVAVADFVAARGRKVLLFPLHGAANPADFARRPHQWLYFGQGRKIRADCPRCRLPRRGVHWIAGAPGAFGRSGRTSRSLLLMPRIAAAYRGGDNHLLSGIARLFEAEGFRLLGAHEVAPEILVPEGALGSTQPSERERADIALGFDYLHATGGFDVGQAVVVAGRHVLAVEAAEGTDDMLARVAQMRANGRVRTPAGSGALVKAPKHGQDRRFDLPSIGPQTIDGVARAGLAGIAVVAGSTIVAEPERLVQAADRAGIFVLGAPAGSAR